MGDTWPYGPPAYVSWRAVFNWFTDNGFSAGDAAVFAAIGSAESGLDYRVVNNTPATRDYSVGIYQVNYYGSLYAGRAREFGTPAQLVAGGLNAQSRAAHFIWSGAGGWTPWSTYNSGAYRAYLHGYTPGGGAVPTSGEPTVRQGSTGPAVVTLQTDLHHLGYALAIDGVFGPATRGAVVNFQGRHHLAQDGIVGPLTWAAIGKALGASLTPPQPKPPPPSAPPPPNEPPGHIDAGTLHDWSSLVTTTGHDLSGQLATLAHLATAIGGLHR